MQKRASVLLQEAKESAAAVLHTAEERKWKTQRRLIFLIFYFAKLLLTLKMATMRVRIVSDRD